MAKEREIFCAALEYPPAERAVFLDAACAGAAELRARIEALLHANEAAGGFLAEERVTLSERSGSRIGRYLLREKVGEGGFGVVYLAEQEQPVQRTVALKIIKLGMDTRAVVTRFEAERQALAMMDHPNIARVLDGGATETGRPYFVMELVRGVPITHFCNEHRLTIAERLALFQQVCRAVHHAHQKGVIHRDLKPSNILITLQDKRPSVKVIDFGIAKATRDPLNGQPLVTRMQMFVGTPAYMSPEQVGIGGLDVDTRSDIYSLGALLYELLCDSPVIAVNDLMAAGYAEVLRLIHHSEPVAPSQRAAALPTDEKTAMAERRQSSAPRVVAELRGDLDRIVLKCLEKDRTRRYETTDALELDLERYLRNEPVTARPATISYLAFKFFRRHNRSVSAAVLGGLLLAVFGIYHTRQLAIERDRAQAEARKTAKVSELLKELVTSADPFRSASNSGALEESAARVLKEFADEPAVRAEILNSIGRVHLRRGDHERALPILDAALLAGRQIGVPDLNLAQTLTDLGILWRERGDMARAVSLFEEACAIRRDLLGESNEVAISLVELGRARRLQEKLDEAEALFREALAIRRRVLGPEDREIATSLGDVGVVLWERGQMQAAQEFLEQCRDMHRRTVGAGHPNYGHIQGYLGLVALDGGDLLGAEHLTGEALAILRQSVGEKHWRTARMLGQLGDIWRRQGKLDLAANALDEALALTRASLGEPPSLSLLEIDRARVHLDLGEATAAEALLRDALRLQRHGFPEDGWHVASTKSLLAAALLKLGQTEEAEMYLREAAAVLKEMPGPQGYETLATKALLATLTRP